MEETSIPVIKQGWLRAIVFLLVWFVCFVIVSAPFYKFLVANTTIYGTIYQELIQLIGTVAAIYICRVYIDKKNFISLGFQFLWKDFMGGCLLGIALISLSCLVIVGAGWVDISFKAVDPAALVNNLTLFIIVAAAEEFLCRTYLLSNLMESMNKYLALLISASIFGIFHVFNPNFTWVSLGNLIVAGILLGLWYIFRRNIWFSVGLHLTWNYFQGAVYGFEVSGMKIDGKLFEVKRKAAEILSGGSFGIEGSVATLLILIVGCYLLDKYLRKTANNGTV